MEKNCDNCYHAVRPWAPGKDCKEKKLMDLIRDLKGIIKGCRNWKSFKRSDSEKDTRFSPEG